MMRLGVKPWEAIGPLVDDDDGHAEEHDEDDCDVDGGGAMMRSV